MIILNKLLTENDLCTWSNLSGSTQSIIKLVLLDRISLEASDNIELSYTVAKMAASFLPDNSWPELLPFLYQCVTGSSSNNYTKVSAFFILGILAEEIGETMVPCLKDLHSLFLNTLNDDTFLLEVRIMATKAVINFIHSVPSSNEKERFLELLPSMMKTLTDASSNSEQEDVAEYVLKFYIELAENEPRFL